jgi:regulator of replication initiation timing
MDIEERVSRLYELSKEISDPHIRFIFDELFAIIEELLTRNRELTQENQKLRDEINRLKGEKGKPDIKPNKVKRQNISSDKERSRKKPWKKQAKKKDIPIDEEVECQIDTSTLPPDAVFKYYDSVIQQDIEFKRKNTLFKIEVYYSPTENKTYRAILPPEYTGYHANGLKSFLLTLHNVCDVTTQKILDFTHSTGIQISKGALSSILLGNTEWLFQEKQDIQKAGLAVSYAQTDATASRVRGINYNTQIICNDFFTSYTTLRNRTRLDVLAAFQGLDDRNNLQLIYNEETIHLLDIAKVPVSDKEKLHTIFDEKNEPLTLPQFIDLIKKEHPELHGKKVTFTKVKEAFAFAFYHLQDEYPIIEYLMTDDASEYNNIALFYHALCWIHDARYYKKLIPVVPGHKTMCDEFMEKYWEYYHSLLDYKEQPTEKTKDELYNSFDQLFVPDYKYAQLNTCINRTVKNKEQLLVVLKNPKMPTHNNNAELGARQKARKRDISYHTMTQKGLQIQDAWMTIVQTAKKLGVDIYSYIKDVVNNKPKSLATNIYINANN